jgi:hypothetical protein
MGCGASKDSRPRAVDPFEDRSPDLSKPYPIYGHTDIAGTRFLCYAYCRPERKSDSVVVGNNGEKGALNNGAARPRMDVLYVTDTRTYSTWRADVGAFRRFVDTAALTALVQTCFATQKFIVRPSAEHLKKNPAANNNGGNNGSNYKKSGSRGVPLTDDMASVVAKFAVADLRPSVFQKKSVLTWPQDCCVSLTPKTVSIELTRIDSDAEVHCTIAELVLSIYDHAILGGAQYDAPAWKMIDADALHDDLEDGDEEERASMEKISAHKEEASPLPQQQQQPQPQSQPSVTEVSMQTDAVVDTPHQTTTTVEAEKTKLHARVTSLQFEVTTLQKKIELYQAAAIGAGAQTKDGYSSAPVSARSARTDPLSDAAFDGSNFDHLDDPLEDPLTANSATGANGASSSRLEERRTSSVSSMLARQPSKASFRFRRVTSTRQTHEDTLLPIRKVIDLFMHFRQQAVSNPAVLEGSDMSVEDFDYVQDVLAQHRFFRPDFLEKRSTDLKDQKADEELNQFLADELAQHDVNSHAAQPTVLRSVLQFTKKGPKSGEEKRGPVQPSAIFKAAAFVDPREVFDGLDLMRWDFDIFEFAKLANGRPLYTMAMGMMYYYGLFDRLSISEVRAKNFFSDVEFHYHADNPYHNSTHAADVLQSTIFLIEHGGFRQHLSDIELLAVIIATVAHDVDHPGLANPFQIKTMSPLALLYSNQAVLEMHHCSTTFALLMKVENYFIDDLPMETKLQLRDIIITLILATDLGRHFEYLGKYQTQLVRPNGEKFAPKTPDEMKLMLSIFIKASDVSNIAKAMPLYLQWTDRIMEEFFKQGDYEKSIGVSVSPFCSRDTKYAKCQIGFANFITLPLFETLAHFDSSFQICLDLLQGNKRYWEEVDAAGVDPNPQLTPGSKGAFGTWFESQAGQMYLSIPQPLKKKVSADACPSPTAEQHPDIQLGKREDSFIANNGDDAVEHPDLKR